MEAWHPQIAGETWELPSAHAPTWFMATPVAVHPIATLWVEHGNTFSRESDSGLVKAQSRVKITVSA